MWNPFKKREETHQETEYFGIPLNLDAAIKFCCEMAVKHEGDALEIQYNQLGTWLCELRLWREEAEKMNKFTRNILFLYNLISLLAGRYYGKEDRRSIGSSTSLSRISVRESGISDRDAGHPHDGGKETSN